LKYKFWKILLGFWLSIVIIVGLSFKIVDIPQNWFEFPNIPGLENKARIIFFHVPTAWIAVIAFLMSMVNGIRYLRKNDLEFDIRSSSAAGLGLVFCILATVTGAIWAKFNWGAYWNWDPRQTSIFVLMLIYGAYFALRSAIDVDEKRASLSAVYSIVAFVTVPFLVFIMPRMMTGLHPGSASDDGAGPVVDFSMDTTMYIVFLASLFGFTILYLWMYELKVRLGRIELHYESLRSHD
jgi:heme exporter protein C